MSSKPTDEVLGPALVQAATQANLAINISLVTPEGVRHVYSSPEACRILGRSEEELRSHDPMSFIAPEERPRLAALVARRLRGEAFEPLVETAIIRPDGTRVPIALATNRVELGGVPASLAFFLDLSQRRAAEDQVAAERERLRRLIEGAPDAIVISGQGGRSILYANPAAGRLLGFEKGSDLVGHSLAEFLPPEEVALMRERISASEKGPLPDALEYHATARGGGHVVVEVNSRPFEYEGQPAVIAFARDVSERVRWREQLMRADRLAALGTLAAGVAHEINNPLTSAGLNLELLERRLAKLDVSPEELGPLKTLTSELRASTDRVAAIVRDLRAFSRADDAGLGAVDLGRVMLAAERMAAHATRHLAKIVTDLPQLPWVVGTPGRLEQVLVNLLVNAAQAFESHRAENEIAVRGFTEGDDHVVVEVADNGRGIAPEHLPHIFDPFFTTKPVGVGTGLGLAICQSIVSGYGGELSAVSATGRGTTMRVRLKRARLTTPEKGQPAVTRQTKRASLLLIDDEPGLVRSLSSLLKEHHQVATTSDPQEGLKLLLENPSYDLVLCDLMMPGLSGMDLYQKVAEARPGVERRFIFMTGGVFGPVAERFLELVPNPRLAKPFPVEQLEALIEQMLLRPPR